jgi:predicted DNA-binding mobile mystery protein A
MRNQKKLALEHLDQKLKSFKETSKVHIPEKGWIHTIRTTLNMTLDQLGQKLNMTKMGVKKIEEREAAGSISIKVLQETANALDMRFVYGFIPLHGSVEKLVDMKAKELAKKIVLRTNQNMKLENQGNNEKRIAQAIEELAEEIKREMHKSIWD